LKLRFQTFNELLVSETSHVTQGKKSRLQSISTTISATILIALVKQCLN